MRQSAGPTVRYSAGEIEEMIRRGEDRTDWERVKTMTDEELEAAIDPEDEGYGEPDWSTLMVGIPLPKRQLTVRLDGDIIDWFKGQGPGYQTRMNAVLRRYVDAMQRAELRARRTAAATGPD